MRGRPDALLVAAVVGVALGGSYAGAKVQENGSLIVAGVIALGSFLMAEEVARRGRPVLWQILAVLHQEVERLDMAKPGEARGGEARAAGAGRRGGEVMPSRPCLRCGRLIPTAPTARPIGPATRLQQGLEALRARQSSRNSRADCAARSVSTSRSCALDMRNWCVIRSNRPPPAGPTKTDVAGASAGTAPRLARCPVEFVGPPGLAVVPCFLPDQKFLPYLLQPRQSPSHDQLPVAVRARKQARVG